MSDRLAVAATVWRGLPAVVISGTALRVVVGRYGGAVLSLRALADQDDDAAEALWQPPWTGGPPPAPDARGPWGAWPDAPLLATIGGSSLCLPIFGPPAAGDGQPTHGEVCTVAGELSMPDDVTAVVRLWLPRAGLTVERRIGLDGEAVTLTTTVRHDGRVVRHIDWCEHLSLGLPFIDGARIDVPAVGPAMIDADPGRLRSRFAPGTSVSPDAVLSPIDADAPPCGDVACIVPAAGWLRVRQPRDRRSLRVAWDLAAFPFLVVWTEHGSYTAPPWSGTVRARGLELSTRPFPAVGAWPSATHAGRPTRAAIAPGAVGATRVVRLRWSRDSDGAVVG